jgi:hypothetical protein
MLSRLVTLLDPSALTGLLASNLGVPKEALSLFMGKASSDLESATGISVVRDSLVKQLATGDLSMLQQLYGTLVGTPAMWPTVSAAAAEWLRKNDANGIALAVLQNASRLPFKGFDRQFENVEQFLQEGVFPLLQEANSKTCAHCGVPVPNFDPDDLVLCEGCGLYLE